MADVIDNTVSISECIQGTPIGGVVSGSQLLLQHSGDTATLICPAKLSKVVFAVKMMKSTHQQFQWPRPNGPTEKTTVNSKISLSTGETHTTEPIKEQYLSPGTTILGIAFPNGVYIENMDVIITISEAIGLDGKPYGVNQEGFIFTWLVQKDQKDVATGTEVTSEAALKQIEAYVKDHSGDVLYYQITDAGGNIVKSGVHQPTDTFPWWIVGVAVAVAVAIVVIWYFYRRRASIPAPAAPAVAPAAAPSSVVVVK